jgi:AhpD family alkylhydroperoxidase
MANPLVSVPWDDCLLSPRHDRELQRLARRRMGLVPPALPYLSHCPWLARTLIAWHPDYSLLLHLDMDLADLVAMIVSQENSCRNCYAATRAMLRLRGFSEQRV